MTDQPILAQFDDQADRLLEDSGLDPDGPLEQFTFDAGFKLGKRFSELWPVDEQVRDRLLRQVMREALGEFVEIFPRNPDSETVEVQTYFLGPLVSKFLCGRGLTVPQLARIARVTPEHIYHLKRRGLSLLFEEEVPAFRSGVNRRFSGLDGRETHLTLDLKGVTTKRWPEPVAFVQPFLLGILAGVQSWLDTPQFRVPIEEGIKRALPVLLADPILGELFDGLVAAVLRVAQSLRDDVLVMKTEKDQAQRLVDTLVELTNHCGEVLRTLAEAGVAIRAQPKSLPAGIRV